MADVDCGAVKTVKSIHRSTTASADGNQFVAIGEFPWYNYAKLQFLKYCDEYIFKNVEGFCR